VTRSPAPPLHDRAQPDRHDATRRDATRVHGFPDLSCLRYNSVVLVPSKAALVRGNTRAHFGRFRGVDLSHFNIRRVMGEAAAKL